MRRHPAVVGGEVVWGRSMAEDVHEEEAVWAEPGGDFSKEHLVVLHVLEHLLGASKCVLLVVSCVVVPGSAYFDRDYAVESA